VSIELDIKITSPLTPDDKDLLSGVAVMVLAIANHELAKQAFPDTFPDEDDEDGTSVPEVGPPPCGAASEDGMAVCMGGAGHRGRHRFRATGPVN